MNTKLRPIRLAAVLALAAAVAVLGGTAAEAAKKGGGRPGGEAAGNNLSFPVIWSDGVTKVLRGAPGVENLNGAMWYWWGTDLDGNPESCLADPDDQDYCDDGLTGEIIGPAPCADRTDPDCMAVFQQQDSMSDWQAESANWGDSSEAPDVNVHWIDWGDNLESVDWYTRSKVRTEVVLIQDLTTPMLQYGIRHLEGWGISELWGLATVGLVWDPNPDDEIDETVYYTYAEKFDGYQATVYSGCARLTIQKLLLQRDDACLEYLEWDEDFGHWTSPISYPEGVDCPGDVVNGSIFNKVVWEGGDGPGFYSAEINVKGKVIYGYTWDVKNLNDTTPVPPATKPSAAGDYRVTFSLDSLNCPVVLNTFFDAYTQVQEPAEEEALEAEEEPGGGAVGVIDVVNNLTYMDVRILERSGGKKPR
jgi:hypothetical protein